MKNLFLLTIFSLFITAAFAEVLIVPTQHETIQDGIDAAADSGDVVLVLPGEYEENIDFSGKAVTVAGSGTDLTTLNGGGNGPCVTFTSGEGMRSILAYFTITGGTGQNGYGGAIHVEGAMPMIALNVITENSAGAGGGAVSASRMATPILYRNLFLNNTTGNQGGAIHLTGSAAVILNNTFVGNEAENDGAAFYANIGMGIQFINNIVVHNSSGRGGAVYGTRFVTQVDASYNDVWGNDGGNYGNIEEGDGAISADPLFIDEENDIYHLTEDSPCIDAGDPNYLNDFDGSRADMGYYSLLQDPDMELPNVEPEAVGFEEVAVDNDSAITITIINPNEDGEIRIDFLPLIESPFSIEDLTVTLEGEEEFELEITFAPEDAVEYSDTLRLVCATSIELADTLDIPYPLGTIAIGLSGIGVGHGFVSDDLTKGPVDYKLLSCYPNPFNSSLEVTLNLEAPDEVTLDIYNQTGRLVRNLYSGNASTGISSYNWTPANMAAGLYIVRLKYSRGKVEIPVQYLK
ncbi:MAG: T9SS type A sorting domain-containing protein [Candidatus Hatepunaea meridiana]|nr:T9SS type A sorting domain-containing protein [Candidatus Hatepunaea meridiana]